MTRSRWYPLCGATFIALLLLSAPVSWGQGKAAEILGTVRDEAGTVLEGVQVTARNLETGVARSDVTSGSGQYRLPALMPGLYNLKAEVPGFAAAEITGVTLTIGLELRHDFALQFVAEDSLTVLSAAPIIDLAKSEVAGFVLQPQIETLPSESRNYLAMALLMPGTSQDAGRSFFETVNVGASMTFNSTVNIVDGVANNWAEDGEPRQNFPQDAVRELKVNQSQYTPAYGQASGGLVQVITRSGTNTFQGSLFEFYRDERLNTQGVFETSKPDYDRHQFGVSFGGPILRNRTHFFFAFERTELREFYTISTGQPSLYSSLEGTFVRPGFTNLYSGRIDHQLSPSQSLFVRYAQEDSKRTCQGCGGTSVRAGWDQEVPRRSAVVGYTWLRSPGILNELRLQYAKATYRLAPPGTEIWTDAGEYPARRLDRLQPAYRFPSLAYGSIADLQGIESRKEIRDTFTFQVGPDHDFELGGEYNRMPYLNDRALGYAGIWIFAEDQPFNPNDPASIQALRNPILFVATRPPYSIERPSTYWALFAHDTWRLRDNLTISAGLRYEQVRGLMNEDLDISTLPGGLPALYRQLGLDPKKRGDDDNFGPRLGLAWDPSGNGAMVVRVGYGLYYNHIRILGNSFELLNLREFDIVISNPSYPDPYDGRDPLEFASTAPPNISVVANDYEQPYSHQFNLGASRTLGYGTAVHLDAVYARTRNDRKIVDRNLPDPVTGQRPLPEWGRIDEYQSISRLDYRALYTRAEKRFTNGSLLMLSYTLAKSEDDDPLGRFTDANDRDRDYGPSTADRRHAVVASGVWQMPWNTTLGAVWTFRSDLPFSALAGRDLNNDGFANDLVPGTKRNQGARDLDLSKVNAWRAQFGLPPVSKDQIDSTRFSSLDVRLSKAFSLKREQKLELIVQVFNLTNRTNLQAPYTEGRITNALSTNFGRIFTAGEKRRFQLGVSFTF